MWLCHLAVAILIVPVVVVRPGPHASPVLLCSLSFDSGGAATAVTLRTRHKYHLFNTIFNIEQSLNKWSLSEDCTYKRQIIMVHVFSHLEVISLEGWLLEIKFEVCFFHGLLVSFLVVPHPSMGCETWWIIWSELPGLLN